MARRLLVCAHMRALLLWLIGLLTIVASVWLVMGPRIIPRVIRIPPVVIHLPEDESATGAVTEESTERESLPPEALREADPSTPRAI